MIKMRDLRTVKKHWQHGDLTSGQIAWLIEQATIVDKIKDFCEYESDICTDLIEENRNKINTVLFEGKQRAFNSVINHIKNFEEGNE